MEGRHAACLFNVMQMVQHQREFFVRLHVWQQAEHMTIRSCVVFAGTNYIETLRMQIHANCRLRRVYFSDRLYAEEELPPEFKLYLPVQK